MSLLKELGEDVGGETQVGKALKATGTLVKGVQDWHLRLASNYNIAEVVWEAARIAWAPPLAPTQAEADAFLGSIGAILQTGDDRTSVLSRVVWRSRPRPLVIMRFLTGTASQTGPWLATLIAAVHAGAADAVKLWAGNALSRLAAEGTKDLHIGLEDMLILMDQAAKAADALVNDLRAVACNDYWSRIPQQRMYVSPGDNLPPLVDRDILDERWELLLQHYSSFDAPVYCPGGKVTRGIEWRGKAPSLRDSHVVWTMKEFLDHVETETVASEVAAEDTVRQQLVERCGERIRDVAEFDLRELLALGVKDARLSTWSDGRVVVFNKFDNIMGLLSLGAVCKVLQVTHNLRVTFLSAVASGIFSQPRTADDIVCLQTAVGLFAPKPPATWKALVDDEGHERGEPLARWHLQAVRVDRLDDGQVVTYELDQIASSAMGHTLGALTEHAGVGPLTNRPVSDSVNGLIHVNNGALEVLCGVRGQVVTADYGRILACLLQSFVATPGLCDEWERDLAEPPREYAYTTPDLVIKALNQGRTCVGDGEHDVIYLLGDNMDW